jgi:hypothetical protein
MPLGPGVRYRFKKGTHIRLAFKGNRVIEAKNTATGATHTPDEFAADRARRRRSAKTLSASLTAMRGRGAFRK